MRSQGFRACRETTERDRARFTARPPQTIGCRDPHECKTRIVLAVLPALVVAGCTSTETKNEYVDTVNGIQNTVIEASNSLSSAPVTSEKDAIAAFETAEAQVKDAVDQLEEVEVPEEAQDGHEELVAGFAELSQLITDVREQVEKGGGEAAFQELKTKGAEIDKRIDDAITQINTDLGRRVGSGLTGRVDHRSTRSSACSRALRAARAESPCRRAVCPPSARARARARS